MKTNFNNLLLALFAASTLLLAACDSDSGSDDDQFSLSLSSVDPLEGGFHYEGWIIVDGSPVSTGKFNVTASGAVIDLSGSTIGGGVFDVDVEAATAFVLTIEPNGDTDSVPSATKYMGGDFVNGAATLSPAHGSSFGVTFEGAYGEFILATPTNGADSDENSGIWWLNLTSGTAMPGLYLADLPAGWKYEGWVVIDGTPVTTGTFTMVNGVDEFDGFSGTESGPPFPGEDFLSGAPSGLAFPTDLSGGTAVISIEPFPDSDPAPFTLKPLVGMIPTGATPFTVYPMDNNSSTFPSGTVEMR